MKKVLFQLSVFFVFIPGVFSQDFPKPPDPPKLVNDFAGLLTDPEEAALESKLFAFEDSTSIEIAVVTIASLGGYPVDEYAIELFGIWGIGKKGKDNGILILIAKEDKKFWITSGYGMEGALPDLLIRRITDNDFVPAFRQNRYYEGLDRATDRLIDHSKNEYTGDKKQQRSFPWEFLIFVFVVIFFLARRMKGVRRYSSQNDIPFWIAWSLLNSAGRSSGGSWGSFSSGSGGFGGFGGGSTGGGGAGGSW
jgi:uncharacterized protein